MSSNVASNSAGTTSKGMYDVDIQKDLKNFDSFGKVMNLFLTRNLHEWKLSGHPFPMYNLEVCGELDEEMLNLNKSILIFAYLFRRKFFKLFQENFEVRLDGDETYKLFRSIPDRHYMYHYLVHLACLYEKTMFDYSINYNVAASVVVDHGQCIESRFFEEGGFKKLYIAADIINVFYDALVVSFGRRFPDIDVLTPFTRAVNIIERRRRYKDWENDLKLGRNTEENPKDKLKLQTLISIGSYKYRLGYVGVNKNLSQDEDSTSNTSTQTMHTSIVGDSPSSTLDETDLKGKDFLAPSTSSGIHIDATQNEATNTATNMDSSDETLLIFSENFLKKYLTANESKPELKYKRDIKIYCPEKITEVSIFSMKTLVDNNHKFEPNVLPTGMRAFDTECFGEFDTDIILDTSSEEEDDLDSYQESIRSQAMGFFQELLSFPVRTMKFLLGEYTKKENLLEFLYTLVPKEENSEGSIGAIPKAKIPIETKSRSSEHGTGATPMANTPAQRENESTQNTSIASHSSTPDMPTPKKSSLRRNRYTADGKREWRKKPVKRI